MDDEARQVGSRRDIGPDGTELLLAELLDELRREGHQDDQGQVVCNHDHGLQLGRPEIVLEEVAVHRLPVHIGHDENHGGQGKAEKGPVLKEGAEGLQEAVPLLFLLHLDILLFGQAKVQKVDHQHGAGDEKDCGKKLAAGEDLRPVVRHLIDAEGQDDGTDGLADAGPESPGNRKNRPLAGIFGHDRGHGPVGNVYKGVGHPVEDIGDIGVDEVLVLLPGRQGQEAENQG